MGVSVSVGVVEPNDAPLPRRLDVMTARRVLATTAIAAAVVALAGCSSSATTSADPFARHDFGRPGFVSSITPDVEFYPACGNETLTFNDEVWYQYDPANINDFPNPKRTLEAWSAGNLDTLTGPGADDAPADPAGALGAGGPGAPALGRAPVAPGTALAAVAPPGDGDDIGTLIVYGGHIAYWQADSDHLATWLTTHEITYNWVC